MRSVLKPSDLLTLSFLVLLSGLAVYSSPANPSWVRLLATYAVLAVAILAAALYRTKVNLAKKGLYFAFVVALFTVLFIFNSLGTLISSIQTTTFDSSLSAIDYKIFGINPTEWMDRLVSPALTVILQFAYVSYYFITFLLGVVFISKGRLGEFEEFLFGSLLCFYLSYICYMLVPANGPRFALNLNVGELQAYPFIKVIQDTLDVLEKNKIDAFPSGHTAISLMSLYYAWKKREKKLFVVLIPVVTGLIISTVYLRYHYVIDVIGGIALTGLTIVMAPGLRRLFLTHPVIQTTNREMALDIEKII